ncbi:HlyD family efflux transporter periplasmic adaptor subunit [Thiorhodococcus mannitoliphagus]|uniref:HlyD family efflux transporter periplasmic adaptor subunit n=1 Tax=Thiorhodococcus mannitoliphagus TaxID=329406 RepID=A0A6P1DZ24_9GAMM|nr:HlyD family efflux transporter periplasmic adaptor subunit [Thiorhodococcus mannitoliphagus]NEX21412.1 HlyD family efflux transporter periplasmic adaptor subunit [Thiorhodococcus mannitoliphagus]
MPRRILPILIFAVGIGTFLVLKETRPVPIAVVPKERIWRVEVTQADLAEHRPILSLFGRIEAPDRVRAAAPVAGRLIEINVRDGDLVSKGELLAKLDPRDLLPRLEKAKADLEKERLQLVHDQEALEQERKILELGRLAVERANTVQAKKLASLSSVDEAREQYARAQLAVTLREQSIAAHPARLSALEAAYAEAERDAARGTITAPFEGRIGLVEAAAGDQLQPNETILTLYPLEGLYIRAKIPGAFSDELREALQDGARLEAKGLYAGQPISAVLERLSGEADARGVDALLRLAPGSNAPLGAFVSLQLERPATANSIALPFAALHGGDRIFVVQDGRLKGIRVQRLGELVEPDTGQDLVLVRAPELKSGDQVMITHLPHAVETLKVEPLQ